MSGLGMNTSSIEVEELALRMMQDLWGVSNGKSIALLLIQVLTCQLLNEGEDQEKIKITVKKGLDARLKNLDTDVGNRRKVLSQLRSELLLYSEPEFHDGNSSRVTFLFPWLTTATPRQPAGLVEISTSLLKRLGEMAASAETDELRLESIRLLSTICKDHGKDLKCKSSPPLPMNVWRPTFRPAEVVDDMKATMQSAQTSIFNREWYDPRMYARCIPFIGIMARHGNVLSYILFSRDKLILSTQSASLKQFQSCSASGEKQSHTKTKLKTKLVRRMLRDC
jgi:hypothetical protein